MSSPSPDDLEPHFATLRALFDAARQQPHEEREACVRRLAGDDQALVGEVLALLAAAELDSTAFAANTQEALAGQAAEPLPEWIGSYRVLSLIGRGGMGVVYLAEQLQPVKRRVALKLIKLGMDSLAVTQRFQQERQALAVMNHDAIARVLDAGTTERGQPWFAMELVEGEPITDYCDAHGLSVRERILLMQQVCAGVQHAHQKGVIHRDLKPGNILVARQGEGHVAKVIDFGIAKAIEPASGAGETMHGSLLGTPEYMSPEQATGNRGQIDTRTDVYSLGVVLYELLTGHLPIASERLPRQDVPELRRVICEVEPPRPSTRLTEQMSVASTIARVRRTTIGELRRHLAGDLDWVVLKAMAKQAEQRYASASEFAADLQRYLDLEPVQAGPPTTSYRLRKFVRRNRAIVVACSLVAITLIAGISGTSVGISLANENARIAGQREHAAVEARASAERALRSLHELSSWFVTDLHDLIEHLPGSTRARRELVEKGMTYLEVLGKERPADRAQQLATAVGYAKIGRVQGWPYSANLADPAGALSNLDRAERIFERLLAEKPNDEHARLLWADTVTTRADIFQARGETDAAAACQERARNLAKELPENDAKQRMLWRLEVRAGALMIRAAKIDAAEQHYENALAVLDAWKSTGNEADELEHVLDVCHLHAAIGQLHGNRFMPDRWDPERAVEHFGKSLSAVGRLIEHAPLNSFLRHQRADVRAKLARVHDAIEQFDTAVALFGEAITETTALLTVDPQNHGILHSLANQHEGLGLLLRDRRRFSESIASYDAAIATIERLRAVDTTDRNARRYHATMLEGLAKVYFLLGDVAGVNRAYDRALAVWRQVEEAAQDPDSHDVREVLPAMNRYASRLREMNEPMVALEVDRRVVALAEQNLVAHPDSNVVLADVSSACSAMAAALIAGMPATNDQGAQVAAWSEVKQMWLRCQACLVKLQERNALEAAEEEFLADMPGRIATADDELARLAR